jgi:hypothetical protein
LIDPLIALARLLARQAAAEFVGNAPGSGDTDNLKLENRE